VIGLDSVKVYRGLSIGAASPTEGELDGVRLHLVGVVSPSETFSTGRYLELARAAVEDVTRRGRRALVLGGTPLYLQALLRGFFPGPPADAGIRARLAREAEAQGVGTLHARLCQVDPEAGARILPRDFKRIARALEVFELTGTPISVLQREQTRRPIERPFRVVGLRMPPERLRARQRARIDRMFEQGFVEEVRALLRTGTLKGEAAAAIGYREVAEHLRGERTLAEAHAEMVRATHALVRKQMKWLRRFPEIRWVDRTGDETVEEVAGRVVLAFGAGSTG
jgi:tRNA dimethylallyltransferase